MRQIPSLKCRIPDSLVDCFGECGVFEALNRNHLRMSGTVSSMFL